MPAHTEIWLFELCNEKPQVPNRREYFKICIKRVSFIDSVFIDDICMYTETKSFECRLSAKYKCA